MHTQAHRRKKPTNYLLTVINHPIHYYNPQKIKTQTQTNSPPQAHNTTYSHFLFLFLPSLQTNAILRHTTITCPVPYYCTYNSPTSVRALLSIDRNLPTTNHTTYLTTQDEMT
jgi:hypothetical protein